ncbi:MAG: type III pantothenate kinase [Muribaculaceae bacterium]|nr:type III pantothenate kinase [Muribaculaceae bacterium]
MDLRLTIDRGNTALKAALWDCDGNILAAAKGDESLPAGELVQSLAKTAGAPSDTIVSAAVYCSVVDSDRADDLDSLRPLCRRLTDLSSATPMPLTIDYQTPATLGADRIAAALGALAMAGDNRPLLVSDIGTAVTYDFIDLGRVYRGGNIAPGIDLRLRALAAFTDALPAVSSDGGPTPIWGTTTAEAMRSGAVRGVAAELDYYHRSAGINTLAVLTGGSAELLIRLNLITFDYIHDPYLVHKGLYSIIDR